MANRKKPDGGMQPNHALNVTAKDGESAPLAIASAILAAPFRHAATAMQIHKVQFGHLKGGPGNGDYADAISSVGKQASRGDLPFASELLAAQALSLDSIFTEMARRMALNMGEHLGAADTYARIALKAQAQSRATLETLVKLHQPREQTVRHVHVNEGGQAVIADQFHNHAGGHQNAESAEQPHAARTGAAGSGPAMLGHDPKGNVVPVPRDQEREAVPNARRQR